MELDVGVLIQELNALLAEWLATLITPAFLLQLAALGVALFVAGLLQLLITRTPDGLLRRLRNMPSGRKILRILSRVRLPLTAWLVTRLTLTVFRNAGWDAGVLVWAVPLLVIWFYYRLAVVFLEIGMAAPQASFWRQQVLRPLAFLVVALHATGLLDGVLNWGFTQPVHVTVGTVLTGIVIVTLFVVASRLARTYLQEEFLPQAGIEPALTQALSNIAAYTVIVVGVLFALSAVGIPLTILTVIAGGLSVGLGFGLQDIVNNFLSGFILMFERSIGPGDVIQVGETYGIVESIGVRSVTLRTRDNVSLVVPNSWFLSDVVTNFTHSERLVRVHIEVGVSYESDPRVVEQALLEAAKHPQALDTPSPRVRFNGFGDSSLDFALLLWTEDAHRLPGLRSELRYQIWDALQSHGIEIPFPQRDIHIRSGLHTPAETSDGQPEQEEGAV